MELEKVKILLRKDFLTLKRNIVFLCMFMIVPCALMVSFSTLQDAMVTELSPE